MIALSITKFVELLINKVVLFAGLDGFKVEVTSHVYVAFLMTLSVFKRGVPMVSWLFPTENMYRLCVGLTLDILLATLIFEIIALWLRLYKTVRR